MGQLFLIRHGQASFLTDDYDKLSPLGIEQSRRLGTYWNKKNAPLDRIVSGPCVRQRETVDAFAETYRNPSHSQAHCEVYEEFAEYSGDDVLHHGLQQMLGHDETLGKLHRAFKAATERRECHITFQRLFERILAAWVDGTLQSPEFESWVTFCDRVEAGITRCLDTSARSQRIAIFTSGGPIAIAMRRALQLSPQMTLQTSFMCRNASWSEFLTSSSGRFTLSTFNATPHLDDEAELLTYR